MVKSMVQQRDGRDYLWLVLFLIIFFNGFESGGYQASLWSIGQEYDLSTTSMGIFAAVELLADMLAPLLLGAWADSVGKKRSMTVALVVQLIATAVVWLVPFRNLFVVGMFVLGLTTSALQFIAIAALADAYPVSGKEKIGYITSMYAGEGADDIHFSEVSNIHVEDVRCNKARNAAIVCQGTLAKPLSEISFTNVNVGQCRVGFSSMNTEPILLQNCHLGGEVTSAPTQITKSDKIFER